METLEQRLALDAELAEHALEAQLSDDALGSSSAMTEAMRYAVLGGGKRIRAFLTLEFCAMFGGKRENALDYACALEMVHGYSLVHDDLPCMDDDDLRRGKPSCHKKFGEATALLAGDALLTQAFCCLSRHGGASQSQSNCLAVAALSRCAGAAGMCAGQQIDLGMEVADYSALVQLHSLKTGALIEAACLLGYYAVAETVDPATVEKIAAYAHKVGLAFQIVDDLLDVRSTSEELGKPIGSDAKNGKKTVLTFLSETEAENEAARLSADASELFAHLNCSRYICALPGFLLNRTK